LQQKGAVSNMEGCVISGHAGQGIEGVPGSVAKVFIKTRAPH
jgi:hypothetical protein